MLTITSNHALSASVFEMKLSGAAEHSPGQFVNIALPGLFLRRPISVCDYGDGILTLLYKVVGKGTEAMSALKEGDTLDVLQCLGKGFDLGAKTQKPLLIGGGIGVAPLYYLAKKLLEKGLRPSVILGFNKADEIVYSEKFSSLGAKTIIATADGSVGVKGFVTDALREVDADYFYACGPMPMLRALNKASSLPGEVSLEERMGCGTGICMCCSCKTLLGPKRICKDGPVFKREEILWQ